ncbi:MAG: Fic family protein [Pseudomonadota bacterium]
MALSGHQVSILRKCLMISPIGDLMEIAERTDRTKFRDQVLKPLLDEELLQMTIPDKPTSSKQRYQTTEQGRALLERLDMEGGRS